MKRRTKLLLGGAVVVVVIGGGAGIGLAATVGDENEAPITGATLERASAAALAHTGGGRVTGTEVGDEETLLRSRGDAPRGAARSTSNSTSTSTSSARPRTTTAPKQAAPPTTDPEFGSSGRVDSVVLEPLGGLAAAVDVGRHVVRPLVQLQRFGAGCRPARRR